MTSFLDLSEGQIFLSLEFIALLYENCKSVVEKEENSDKIKSGCKKSIDFNTLKEI